MESEYSSSDEHTGSCASGSSSRRNSMNGEGTCTTGSQYGSNNTKTGRKGDPRMHRAVGARLANPNISLCCALQIGGFEYDNDDDATAVDGEQITLTQRKNQLSRRIRLAQKLQRSGTYTKNCSTTSHMKYQIKKWPPKMTGIYHLSENKRQNESPIDDDIVRSEGTIAPRTRNTSYPVNGGVGECSTDSYHIRARQHPNYHLLVTERNGPISNSFISMENSCNYMTINRPEHQLINQQMSEIEGIVSNNVSGLPKQVERSSQYAQQNQVAQPSTVAITALSQTAASVGMTLEQLALTLRCSNNLSKVIASGPAVTKQQSQLALCLYQSEIHSLYQRAMLLAGYSPEIALNEDSTEHVQFMINAWQVEGERLADFTAANSTSEKPATNIKNIIRELPRQMFQSSIDYETDHHTHDDRTNSRDQKETASIVESLHHHHDHEHAHAKIGQNTNGYVDSKCNINKNGRHIHRLEGKCGHQPVLHQPSGGKPHIDFVIGDRVECYHNVQPSQDLMWPSNYNCEDLSCADSCRDINITESSTNLHNNGSSNDLMAIAPMVGGVDPKIYDRSEIDFESNEWNFDFSASDSVLGLFKLGDTQQPLHHHHNEVEQLKSNEDGTIFSTNQM